MKIKDLEARISALPDDVLEDPGSLFSSVLDLYENSRIDNTNLDENGDMLLFQWGSYDWGQGLTFELDLTRQAIPSDREDPPILQLRCTYRYDPAEFHDTGEGNRWCHNPSQLDEFRQFVFSSEAFSLAASQQHNALEIDLEDVE